MSFTLDLSTAVLFSFLALSRITTAKGYFCDLGQFYQNQTCRDCPRGTYQDKREDTGRPCKPCPGGFYSPYKGAQGVDVCVPCPAGTFHNKAGAISRKECKPCPPGTHAPKGSPSCISCPPGTYISQCYVPPDPKVGYTYETVFGGVCFECLQLRLGSDCRPVKPVELECVQCGYREYSQRNSERCTDCPDGFVLNSEASGCVKKSVQCPPGSELNFSKLGCQTCSFYGVSDGTKCRECPLGSQGSKKRRTSCEPCPHNSFRNQTGILKCKKCKAGQNSNVMGAHFCIDDNIPCPPNFFRTKLGACLTCNRFQRFDEKKAKCMACPKHSLSQGGKSTKCVPCGEGMVTRPEQSTLRCLCEEGWGFVEGSGSTKCEKCPPGSANENPLGYCQKCGVGQYAPRAGMKECDICPTFLTQLPPGQTKCPKGCPKGLVFRRNRGCVVPKTNCPPLYRRKEYGCLEAVKDCPSDSLLNVKSVYFSPSCELEPQAECPRGTHPVFRFANDQTYHRECGRCGPYAVYNTSTEECEHCGFNMVSDGEIDGLCSRCPVGQRIDTILSRCACTEGRRFVNGKCGFCPPGTFGYWQTDGCMPCPAGTFSSKKGSLECSNCPPGFFTSSSGQIGCSRCSEGMSSSGLGDSGCVRPLKK